MSVLLGLDVGSSSVKAALFDAESGRRLGEAVSPDSELPINSPQTGWAEQDPDVWWQHVVRVCAALRQNAPREMDAVKAVGISYQMHGLVALDGNGRPVRPAIIWCDSRAVPYGEQAFKNLGREYCFSHLLNSPGNFTAAKLAWVKENEPDTFRRIRSIMLPGDDVARRMTGESKTTISGLSEAILWDFQEERPAVEVLESYGIDPALLPPYTESMCPQGQLTAAAAAELGLPADTVLAYRGGDQPNNALSLNVLRPGEFAATAGTSGVVFGVGDREVVDRRMRVNSFAHVNSLPGAPRLGVLLCVNGTGILNSWLRRHIGAGQLDYDAMNQAASRSPVGARGLRIYPFGNGAERMLGNNDPGARIDGLRFNRHDSGDILRAAQEGIVFSLNYGINIMREMGLTLNTIKAGQANMFLSPLFRQAFAAISGATIELYRTDGAEGAARGAGIGASVFSDPEEAFSSLECLETVTPPEREVTAYADAYSRWAEGLEQMIDRSNSATGPTEDE